MHKQDTGQQGFTLIEIMIAVTVFAIGILAVASMQVKAIKTDSQANRITEVATSVEETVERITALGYDNFFLRDVDGDGSCEDLNDNGVLDDSEEDDNKNGQLDEWDANNNGVDDRDEVVPPPIPLFNFGLNDTFIVEPDNSITTTADHVRTIGIYTVYWNVAVNQPMKNIKTIRTIIFWTEGGRQRRITLDSVKPL